MSNFFDDLNETTKSTNNLIERNPGLTPERQAIVDQVEKERDEWLKNRDRYQVALPQEQYDIINNAIANAEIPEDEAYRWAAALVINQKAFVPLDEAYRNLEAYNQAIFGEEHFVPKTNFKAIVDCFQLGENTLKQGFLGNKLMIADMSGNAEEAERLLKEIEQLDAENLSMIDHQDRRWWIEALKFSAQSAPFTGYVATAGLLGSVISGGFATGLSFAASMQNAQGLEYIALRKEGASKENALAVSVFSGILQAYVENAIGINAALLGKHALGAAAKKTLTEKIAGNVFKRLHYNGTFASIALKMGSEYVKENFEEGMEEVIQDAISKSAHAFAAELEDYDIEPITAKKLAEDAWENFKGGAMGALGLGVFSTAYNTAAEVYDYKNLKTAAETIPSKEVFVNLGKESPVLEGMSDPQKTEILEKLYDNKQAKRDENIQKEQEDIAEVFEADDETDIITDENGNEIVEEKEFKPEYRNEEGSLVSEYAEPTENEDGTYSSRVDFYDPESEGSGYGHLSYTVDEENGTVKIDEFKTKKAYNYLRNEMYTELAGKFSGYDIVWDTKGKRAASIKEDLEALNPRGKASGLNYFEVQAESEQYKADHKVKQTILKDLEANTKLKATERAGIVAIMDAIAKHQKKTLSDWYNGTFMQEGMFGDINELQEQAKAKGTTAAGGMVFKETLDGARAVIYAAENADFSTMAHELSHVWQKQLFGEDAAEAARIFGASEVMDNNGNITYNWNDRTIKTNKLDENGNPVYISPAENFAYSFEKWLKDGKAPSKEQENVFKKFAEFMKHVIETLRNYIDMKPEIQEFFDKNLKVTDAMMNQAENEQVLKWEADYAKQQQTNTTEETQNNEDAEVIENATPTEFNEEEAVENEALSEEEINALTEGMTEALEALKETKLDDTTQAALNEINEDPDIPAEKKNAALLKATSEDYEIKQANIERYKNRTDLTEEEKAIAIEDVNNNNTTDGNGGGQSKRLLELGKDMVFQSDAEQNSIAMQEFYQQSFEFEFDQDANEETAKAAEEELNKTQKVEDPKVWSIVRDMKLHHGSEIIGKKIDVVNRKISDEGWNQLYEVLDIFRNRSYETFRYVLVNRYTGEIYNQYAVTSKIPSRSKLNPSKENFGTYINRIASEAINNECGIVFVHNHPSGNTHQSYYDEQATKVLRQGSVYMGHMILDHGTYNLNKAEYSNESEWTKGTVNKEKYKERDPLINNEGDWHKNVLTDEINSLSDIDRIASYLDDAGLDTVPVFFTDADNVITALAYYPAEYFTEENLNSTADKLHESAIKFGATSIQTATENAEIFDFIQLNNDVLKFRDARYKDHSLKENPSLWDDIQINAEETLFQEPVETRKEELLHEDTEEEKAIKQLMSELQHQGFYSLEDAADKVFLFDDDTEYEAKSRHNLEVMQHLLDTNKGLMFYEEGSDRFRTVTENIHPDQSGKYQVTWWDAKGPIMHVIRNDAESILSELEQSERIHAKNETDEILFQYSLEKWEEARKELEENYSKEEYDRIWGNINNPDLRDTNWASQCVASIMLRKDMLTVMNGGKIPEGSFLSTAKAKALKALAKGMDGIEEYLGNFDTSIVGTTRKAIWAVNSSLINCNPSKECAQYCYATDYLYRQINSMLKSEMVTLLVEARPEKAAELAAKRFKATPGYKAGQVLRLFDKGDMSEKWIPFIEKLNAKGIPCQIFSKRPELLKNIDPDNNVIMLSIDKSNEDLAAQYPEMPIAFVYSGPEDAQFLLDNEARFLKYGGVILPVKLNHRFLNTEEMKPIPKILKGFTCPIDAGTAILGKGENQYNCQKCDLYGSVGCYKNRGRETRPMMLDYYDLSNGELIEIIGEIGDEAEKKENEELIRRQRALFEKLKRRKQAELAEKRNRSLAELESRRKTGSNTGLDKSTTGNINLQEYLQENEVRSQYENTNKWLKAPNGSDTKLTEKQWLQVRTPNFKKWFGDWENDPQSASKVVDENGEPLVMYHGTRAEDKFEIFDTPPAGNKDNIGSHFGPKSTAEEFSDTHLYEVFLNIKKPFRPNFDFFADELDNAYLSELIHMKNEINTEEANEIFKKIYDIYPDLKSYELENMSDEDILDNFENDENLDPIIPNARDGIVNIMYELMKAGGYDGMRYNNWYEGEFNNECFVVINPNQIKSATDNNGNFSTKDPSILFQEAEPGTEFQTVYHGSPYVLRKAGGDVVRGEELGFDHSKMGTGEGNQSYGWGSYVTQVKGIAESYAEANADKYKNNVIKYNGEKVRVTQKNRKDEVLRQLIFWASHSKFKGSFEKAYEHLKNEWEYDLSRKNDPDYMLSVSFSEKDKEMFMKEIEYNLNVLNSYDPTKFEFEKTEINQNVYTLEIPEDGPNYLQWDKPVSKELKKRSLDAFVEQATDEALDLKPDRDPEFIRKVNIDRYSPYLMGDYEGKYFYRNLIELTGSDWAASQFLSDMGYTGISYPAQYMTGGREDGARNFVIFNENDIHITDWHAKDVDGNFLFQSDFENGINDEILNEAAQFDSWVEYMEYGNVFGIEGKPEEAAGDWYKNVWEIAHNISPTSKEMDEAAEREKIEKAENSKKDPAAITGDFLFNIKKPGALEAFLKMVYQVLHVDEETYASMDPDEQQYMSEIVARTEKTFNHGTWRMNISRVYNGKPLTDRTRKQMLTFIRQRPRDYQAIYADITGQEKYRVEAAENGDVELFKRGRKFNHVKYLYEIENMSPEEKSKLDARIKDDEIREKFKKDNVKMLDPDVEHYIDMVEAGKDKLADELAKQRRDFNEDIERLAGMQERDIIRQYNEYLNLKAEADERKIRMPAGLKNIVKRGEDFIHKTYRGRSRNYNNLVEDWDEFKNQVEAKVKVQERLRSENKIQELEEKIRAEYDAKRMKTLMSKAEKLNAMQAEYNQKREEAAALKKLKDMRKALVKRVMRRVNFAAIDYTKAKEIIAVQKVFEPNMRGGVNKWIGTENKLAREIWSAWNTDSEVREDLMNSLMNKGKFEIIRLLDDTKNEEDFEKLSKKDQKKIEKAMPRQNWIKDLGLDVWKKERDNALQLDIKEVERTVWITDENGNRKEKVITTTEISPDVEELLINAIGQDMTNAIRNKHFEDWTTGEMEELARRINKMFKDGRDLYAAKREAEKNEADRIRKMIRDAINNTGIVINDDDPEDVKKKKQEKINKILGTSQELPGTAANQKEKQQTILDRLLHSYHDANVRRVARILDNYSEGTMTNLLYWEENECFNKQERAKDRRNKKIEDAIKAGNIDIRKLGKTVTIEGFTFTYDEILMIHAADMNNAEYANEQLKENPDMDPKDIEEESAYKAIKYGNLITAQEREAFQNMDADILENDQKRKDNLQAAILANNEEDIKKYQAIPSNSVDIDGNIIMAGTAELKALATSRLNNILQQTENIKNEMLPLIEAIRKDYSEEFDRINKVSIDVFNAPVWREKWYLPLIRKTMLGDTHEQRLRQDLLGHSAGTGKAGTEKGFTKKRVEIGPLHQAPVELGLYTTWADSVERNEHFIAYAGYIRQLNRILFSQDAMGTMQELENRYGKSMKDYLDVYVKEVANPNVSEPKKGLDRVMHFLRGNTAPAYLGWKFSSILKQGIESPAPFMQFINPVEYMHGAMQLATKKWTRDGIAQKSAFMKSRVFDPMVDVINENVEKSFSKKSYYLKKFQQKGMEGLEWIDWACVAPGWIAIYEKEYAKLQGQEQAMYDARVAELTEQNKTRYGKFHLTEEQVKQQAMDDVLMDIEKAAVDKADDCVRLCQPSNRKVDLAPMFKNNSEAAKAVLQFQTALNVIWQNIRYDIPYAMRNKEATNIIGMVLGYVMAGIISGMVTEGLLKGDDDDPEEIAKRIGYYSTTQFIDSVPIVGGNLDALAKKAITGEGSSIYSSSLWPTFDRYYRAASAFVSEDYAKALRNMEQGLLLTTGAPLSGIKEIEAAIGAMDKEPGLELYPEAFLGRRK